jgi:PAS domain S-box-containing protein
MPKAGRRIEFADRGRISRFQFCEVMQKRSALEQSGDGDHPTIARQFRRAVAESTPAAVAILDRSGRIVMTNDRTSEIFAYSRRLIGEPYTRLLASDDRHLVRGLIASVLNKGRTMSRIEVAVTREGVGETPVSIEIQPIKSSRKIAGAIVIASDVTDVTGTGRSEQTSLHHPAHNFLAESVSDGVVVADDFGVILTVNPAMTRITGYRSSELVGRKFASLLPKKAPSNVSAPGSRILNFKKRLVPASSSLLLCRDGREIPVEISLRAFRVEGRSISLAVIRENTNAKELQEGISRREREFATLIENSPDIISRVDRDRRFTYVSPTVRSLFGLSPKHFIGKTTREVRVPKHDWHGFEKACQQAFTTGQPQYREFTYAGRNYRARVIPEFSDSGKIESLMCIDQDISQQKRTEMELRALSSRLLDTQDRERKRIARELHDGTAQNLFAMSMTLSRLLKETTEPQWTPLLKECLALCEQSRKEIRTLSYVLHPPMLDETGLVSALRWYVDGFSERSGIKVKMTVEVSANRFPVEIETALFRVVQECLANIHRHSGSTMASVKLRANADRIVLQVRDWGRGMAAGIRRSGIGIPGMRERISHLLGDLSIATGKRGTTVTATVPLKNAVLTQDGTKQQRES